MEKFENMPVDPAGRGERQGERAVRERFLGCMLGGAVGDALGAPVEFMTRNQILRQFGPSGITRYAPAYGGLGKITDDTQMTLFTAEGLLRTWVRGCLRGVSHHSGPTGHAYLRWLQTQGERVPHDTLFGSDDHGWLIGHRELHSRRAPGNTCLSALRSRKSPEDPARNNSKGCGGVMRVAPAGLMGWRVGQCNYLSYTFQMAADVAALTHGHPTGFLTAGVLAAVILMLADGASLREAVDAAKRELRNHPRHEETLQAIEQAEELARTDVAPEEAIARMGQGWIAEEALAVSIYCALVARDFEHGVILAVNHDGDSDSTGAITGNILGTIHGAGAIPSEWLEPLELREVITEMAVDLYEFKDWQIGEYGGDAEFGARIWKKYPGF